MLGGMRSRVHNKVRDTLMDLYREALIHPTAEPHAFPKEPNRRADLSFFLTGTQVIIDVALTHPFRDAFTMAAAAATAGAAATQYEAVKNVEYLPLVPKGSVFVPFIVDTYGALGDKAVETLRVLVPLYAQRLGITNTVASRIIFNRITGSVIRGVAGIASLG